MKEKVLIVHNYYQIPGGEDSVVANEKKMLEENGHRVIQYSRNNNELKTMSKLQKMLLPLVTIFNLKTYKDVKKLIRENHIDVVHVHNTLNLISPAVYYAALSCKVPVVQTVHNFRLLCPGATFYRDGHICEACVEHGLGCAIKHSCYRGSKVQTLICVVNTWIHRMMGIYGKLNYICLTNFNKEKLLMLKQIKPEQVFVKPNFTYDAKNSEGEQSEYYLFIGRIEKIKGMDILIEAFANMPSQVLAVAGTGSEIETYKEKATQNIKFLGYLQRNELNQVIQKAKAVIVPSQWYETFGMIIIEAFSNGIPVIVGNIGNIGNLVNEGETGYKFEYNSATALKDAIKKFELSDKQTMGRKAYTRFCSQYSPAANYEQLISIYERVTSE